MANLVGSLFLFFFLVHSPQTCWAQETNSTRSILPAWTERLLTEIDAMIVESEENAATFFTAIDGFVENLKTNATSTTENFDKAIQNGLVLFDTAIKELVDGVSGVDVDECVLIGSTLSSQLVGIVTNVHSCIDGEVSSFKSLINGTKSYVNSQLHTATSLQKFAHNTCIVRSEDGSQTTAQERQTFACVRQTHMAIEQFHQRFALTTDVSTARALYLSTESDVASCAKPAGLTEIVTVGETIYAEIETCIFETVSAQS